MAGGASTEARALVAGIAAAGALRLLLLLDRQRPQQAMLPSLLQLLYYTFHMFDALGAGSILCCGFFP